MNNRILCTTVIMLILSSPVYAFDSGSTGADGALLPSVDTRLDLPEDGIFNFTEVNIPAGVTLTFNSNATNTPVIMLVSGNATIDGVIDVSGDDAAPSNGAGNGNVGDDGQPGAAGPGGFRGGRGGLIDPDDSILGPRRGQSGVGPGGAPADFSNRPGFGNICPGIGGSFGSEGVKSSSCNVSTQENITPTPEYGGDELLPLIGGSGGSGGASGDTTVGSGGGGGGGALLIAVSGTLVINGEILANGGAGGDRGLTGSSIGGVGGGGSGGGIRLIATTLSGNGAINANGGLGGVDGSPGSNGQLNRGGAGRIRLEAETFTRTANTSPPFTSSLPGDIFVVGMPVLRIASVAGQPAPAVPSGSADIVLPVDEPNPVTIVLEASNVPLGNTITVTLTPPFGEQVAVVSNALDGTEANSTATASVDLPEGPSVLLATLTFTIAEGQQMVYMQYTDGERIAHIELQADAKGQSRSILVTESGRRVLMPATEPLVSG